MASDPSPSFLHPASGGLILALDWLLFSGSVLSLGLSTSALALLGFVLGTVGTGVIQARYGQDGGLMSAFKGMLGGVAVGIPLPIAGTAAGGAVLALSGLDKLRRPSLSEPSDSDRSLSVVAFSGGVSPFWVRRRRPAFTSRVIQSSVSERPRSPDVNTSQTLASSSQSS